MSNVRFCFFDFLYLLSFPLPIFFVCWCVFLGFPFLFLVLFSFGFPFSCFVLSFLSRSSIPIQECLRLLLFFVFLFTLYRLHFPPQQCLAFAIRLIFDHSFCPMPLVLFILSYIFVPLTITFYTDSEPHQHRMPSLCSLCPHAMLSLSTSTSAAAASPPLSTPHGHAHSHPPAMHTLLDMGMHTRSHPHGVHHFGA